MRQSPTNPDSIGATTAQHPPFDGAVQLLQSILDGVSDGFTAFDRDWHITYINQASADLLGRLGRAPSDVVGKIIWEEFPYLVGTRVYTEYLRAMREDCIIDFDEYFAPLNSWFQIRLFPSPGGLLSYTHDVTAAKMAEAQLSERNRAVALSADIGRVLTSTETIHEMLQGCAEAIVQQLDAAFARIWCLNEADNVLELRASAGMYTHLNGTHGRVPVGLFKIGLIAQEREPHLTNAVVGDPRVGDQEWAVREGMVSFAGYPLIVAGRLVGVAAMFARHTLSESILATLAFVSDEIALGIARKQAEAELSASEQWFATTLSSIGDAVIATDTNSNITFMNAVAEEMTGWPQSEGAGRPLDAVFRIVSEETGAPLESPVVKVLRDKRIVGLANHTVLIARDGARRNIDDSAAPITGHGGDLAGVVLVFHDVSERRIAERFADVQYRVSAALATAAGMEEGTEQAMSVIGSAFDWEPGMLWLANAGEDVLRLAGKWTRDSESDGPAAEFAQVSQKMHFKSGEGIPGRVWETRRPVWVENLDSLSEFPRRFAASASGMNAALAFPLVSHGAVRGVIEFFGREIGAPDEKLQQTLEGIGHQIGQYIDQRQAEESAVQSAALRSAMLSSALDAIVSMDHSGNVVEWNAQAERTFGYTREEAMGRLMAELIIPPALREQHTNGLSRYLVTGEGPVIGNRIEITAIRRDGGEFPVELAISRIDGNPPRFTGFIRDITERKRAEAEQSRLANYNHLLLQSTGEGIYGVDLHGNCTFLNDAGARMLGLQPDDVVGRDMHEVAHHSHIDGSPYSGADCPISRAFTEGANCRVENEVFWRSDGKPIFVEYSSFPIVESGLVRGAVVTFNDISLRKQTREALEASEARYQRIAANVPGMVYQFLLRPDGSIGFPFVSEFSRELYGIDPDFIVSNPHYPIERIHPEDRASFDVSFAESARTMEPWHWIGRFRHANGMYRWIEGASRPTREYSGDILWDGILMDITSRKLAEAELLQAKEAAEAATVAKSQFLATMSHEIRTPMNAVIGMTGLLMDTELNPQQQEYAQIIHDSGDSLLSVINDILDFSKIEAGQMEVEHQPFDLRDCAESALDLVSTRAAEKGIELAFFMPPETPPTVVGDVTRVRQILVNLLSNAVKFTEAGEVVVSVGSTSLQNGLCEVHLEVRDTGIGVPAERMDRLFRSFSQVDPSTTRRYGGTGLGLAISRRLCDMMGGRIWADSVPGQGSTFHVALPMSISPHIIHPPIEPHEAMLENRRLLIVDDNETNRHILSLQASNWGMQALECASAREALEVLRRGERFDVAILDIQMPDMDGLTLATEMRRCCGDDNLPLVGLSSVWPKRVDVTAAGFAQMLTKPIKQSALYNVLATILSGRPQSPSVSGGQSAAPAPIYDPELGNTLPLRILIAEDLLVNQKLMQALLAKFGYRADLAANGLEVLQALDRQTYDVILMDVQMPELDGLEASRIIRKRNIVNKPRIVALTANAMSEDREMCIEAGMDDYLAKPVKPDALRDALIRSGDFLRRQRNPAAKVSSDGAPSGGPQEARGGVHNENTGQATLNAAMRLPVEQIIDPAFLVDLRSMRDILPDLIVTFHDDVLPRLGLMERAIAAGDSAALSQAAHGVKGAAGNVGGRALAALCRELEQKGRSGTLDGAFKLMPSVKAEFEILSEALERVAREIPD